MAGDVTLHCAKPKRQQVDFVIFPLKLRALKVNAMTEIIEIDKKVAHCEGQTDLAFTQDGKFVLTCGADYEVRKWSLEDPSTDPFCFPIEDAANSVVVNGDKFYVGTEGYEVKWYQISEDSDENGTFCRFSGSVNHLDIVHPFLAAGSGDFTCKLIDLSNEPVVIKTFKGHEAPILSVAIDPRNKYLVSSSCDGSVKVWSCENQTPTQVWEKTHLKSNDFSNSSTLCRISWSPDGKLLAIPRSNQVELFSRDIWTLIKTLKHNKGSNYSIVSFSSNGNFLAATSNELLIIWDVNNCNVLSTYEAKDIKSLKWNTSNQLAACDANGMLTILNLKTEFNSTETPKPAEEDYSALFDDDDDFGKEFLELETQLKPSKKKENEATKPLNEAVKEAQKISEDDTRPSTSEDKSEDFGDDIEDDGVYDIGAIRAQYEPIIHGTNDKDAVEKKEDREIIPPTIVYQEPEFEQDSFQPGECEFHEAQYYILYNQTAMVKRTAIGEEQYEIDIEFHETNLHHSLHYGSFMSTYSIAAASNDALLLASNGIDDEGPSKVMCVVISTFDSTKEWSIDLPKEERVSALAAGIGFVAFATEKRNVHVFTTGGIQVGIFSIAGPICCLNAYDNILMVIYYAGRVAKNENYLQMKLIKLDLKGKGYKQSALVDQPVALNPGAEILWAGFTDEGTPCIYGSDGVVRFLKTEWANSWIPVTDTKKQLKNFSDNYFIVGISELQSHIRCIFCKGRRSPTPLPKPIITTIPIQVPICDYSTQKGKLEEEYIRNHLMQSTLNRLSKKGFDVDAITESCSKAEMASLVKLFALALGADRESVAVEVAQLLQTGQAVEGVMRYAHQKRKTALVEKLQEVVNEKEQNEVEETEEVGSFSAFEMASQPMQFITKIDDNDVLRPKSLKDKTNKNTAEVDEDIEDVQENELSDVEIKQEVEDINDEFNENTNDSGSIELKPKIGLKKKAENPFKATKKSSKSGSKRKRLYRDSEEDNSDDEDSRQSLTSKGKRRQKSNKNSITKFFKKT